MDQMTFVLFFLSEIRTAPATLRDAKVNLEQLDSGLTVPEAVPLAKCRVQPVWASFVHYGSLSHTSLALIRLDSTTFSPLQAVQSIIDISDKCR